VSDILGFTFRDEKRVPPCRFSFQDESLLKIAAPIGIVVGQLLFGLLADVWGRKQMYGIELILIIIATLAQCLSADSSAAPIVGVIFFWRVIMGLGIGGDCKFFSCRSLNLIPVILLWRPLGHATEWSQTISMNKAQDTPNR
jgi:MFS family permease